MRQIHRRRRRLILSISSLDLDPHLRRGKKIPQDDLRQERKNQDFKDFFAVNYSFIFFAQLLILDIFANLPFPLILRRIEPMTVYLIMRQK